MLNCHPWLSRCSCSSLVRRRVCQSTVLPRQEHVRSRQTNGISQSTRGFHSYASDNVERFLYNGHGDRYDAISLRLYSSRRRTKRKKPNKEVQGRSLLFSMPVVDEDDISDDEDNQYGVDRPIFNDKTTSLANIKGYYLYEHRIKLTQADFACTKVSFNHPITGLLMHAWNCVFTCPLTGTSFASGQLRHHFNAFDEDDIPDNHKQTVLYSKRRGAEHAAAARALDVIQYRKTALLEPRYCEEDPSIDASASQNRSTLLNEIDNGLVSPEVHYLKEHGMKTSPENFVTDRVDFKGPGKVFTAWTAVFKCPVSGIETPSGTLRTEDVVTDVRVHDTRIFYRKKAGAERAASRRAIDTLRFQKFGTVHPRFCVEDPSRDVILTSSKISSEMIEDDKKGHIAHTIPDDATRQSMCEQPWIGSCNVDDDDYSSLDNIESDEKDTEYYVVSHIPDSLGKPPAHRLLQVASRVVGAATSPHSKAPQLSLAMSDVNQPRSAIDVANTWLASLAHATAENSAEKGNPHRLSLPRNDSDTILVCGKTILASLAAVAQCTPVGSSNEIEPVAKKVIEALWNTKQSTPDADAYTLFLKCLDCENPSVAVEKAETIVEAMVNGVKHKKNGNVLPKPNECTFNTLIQISAQKGGLSGRIAKLTDPAFKPDRDSFFAVLSSSLYQPVEEFETGSFDPDFARECIQRMSELAAETGDDSFQPETKVYNAPLHWSGGPVLWSESRPYARYVPWDNYELIFLKGLRENVDSSDIRVVEAEAMEEWLDMMTRDCISNERVAPNIQTFEAVIQGWLRTVTYSGLEQAENILLRLVNGKEYSGKIVPRLQTFHPIISSWYHTKADIGPSKILEWIGHLENCVSNSVNGHDIRILEMKILACLKEQERHLQLVDAKSIDRDMFDSKIFSAAKLCSQVLRTACDRFSDDVSFGRQNDHPISMSLFINTIRAWENVAASSIFEDDSDEVDQAMAEIGQVFALFENLAQNTISNDTGHGIVLRHQSFSLQLENLVLNSHAFFCSLVETLEALKARRNISESLFLVESMTRIIGELDDIESECMDFDLVRSYRRSNQRVSASHRCSSASDEFCYQIKPESRLSKTRYSFLWQVVRLLEQIDSESDCICDVVRLGILVKDVADSRDSSKLNEAVDKLLERNIRRAPHRFHRSSGAQVNDKVKEDTIAQNGVKHNKRAKPEPRLSLRPSERKRRSAPREMINALA